MNRKVPLLPVHLVRLVVPLLQVVLLRLVDPVVLLSLVLLEVLADPVLQLLQEVLLRLVLLEVLVDPVRLADPLLLVVL